MRSECLNGRVKAETRPDIKLRENACLNGSLSQVFNSECTFLMKLVMIGLSAECRTIQLTES
jgi:hypothetical protein